MKSCIAIWFSFLFLLQGFTPNMDLCCELQKIPILVDHYLEHKAFDGDSFYQFMQEDFFNEGHDLAGKHDTQEHENMPFHGNHSCSHAPIFIPTVEQIEIQELELTFSLVYPDYSEQVNSEFSYQPFQPPKA